MRFVFLTALLGLASAYGQESQPTQIAEQFSKDLSHGKEFSLVALRPLIKLDKGDLRCGRYFILTDGIIKSTGKTVPTLFFLVNANGELSTMQFKIEECELQVSASKEAPTMAMKTKGGIKVVLTVPPGDLPDARMCLDMPDLPRTAKK